MNELERFMRDVESDADLAKKFGTIANRIALADDTLSEAEVKSRAMFELGYKVTATDLEFAAAKNELLDHDELEQVSGGGRAGGKRMVKSLSKDKDKDDCFIKFFYN